MGVPDRYRTGLPSGCRLLDRAPAGPTFIALCFIVRSVDAVGFAAAMTSTFAMTAKIFPNNVATVLVSAGGLCPAGMSPVTSRQECKAVCLLQGSLEVFTGLGLIVGPPVGGWFYHSFGYEVPFMLLGCLLLIMVPFNLYVLPSIGRRPQDGIFSPFSQTLIAVLPPQRPTHPRTRSCGSSATSKSS